MITSLLASLISVLSDSISFLAFAIIPDKLLDLFFESKFLTSVFPVFILKKNDKIFFYIKL